MGCQAMPVLLNKLREPLSFVDGIAAQVRTVSIGRLEAKGRSKLEKSGLYIFFTKRVQNIFGVIARTIVKSEVH